VPVCRDPIATHLADLLTLQYNHTLYYDPKCNILLLFLSTAWIKLGNTQLYYLISVE